MKSVLAQEIRVTWYDNHFKCANASLVCREHAKDLQLPTEKAVVDAMQTRHNGMPPICPMIHCKEY